MYVYIYIYIWNPPTYKPFPRNSGPKDLGLRDVSLRPISLLRLSLPRFVDSKFPVSQKPKIRLVFKDREGYKTSLARPLGQVEVDGKCANQTHACRMSRSRSTKPMLPSQAQYPPPLPGIFPTAAPHACPIRIYIYNMCIYIYVHTYTCVYIYIYMHTCTYIYIYIYIYTCVCIYIYIYILSDCRKPKSLSQIRRAQETAAGAVEERQSEEYKRGRIKRGCSQEPDLQIGGKTGPRNTYR